MASINVAEKYDLFQLNLEDTALDISQPISSLPFVSWRIQMTLVDSSSREMFRVVAESFGRSWICFSYKLSLEELHTLMLIEEIEATV